jgi:hypothetical protein
MPNGEAHFPSRRRSLPLDGKRAASGTRSRPRTDVSIPEVQSRWMRSMGATSKAPLVRRAGARPGVRSQEDSQSGGRLDQDAVVIGGLYRKGRQAMLESVKYHLQAGQKLLQKKRSMSHGAWLPWLRTNADVLGFKHRTTASRLMKAAAVNDASTNPLNEAAAIHINRRLWGNLSAANMPEAEFKEVGPKKKKRPTRRSATEVTEYCIETVRATIRQAITGLRRAHAPRAKFEQLFEALGEILVDIQRQIEADDEARRRIRISDHISGSR